MRAITINDCLNGYIVQVGCQTLVFQTRDELIKELDTYLRNPEEAEKAFLARFPMKTGIMGGGQAIPETAQITYAQEYRRHEQANPTECDARVPPPPYNR